LAWDFLRNKFVIYIPLLHGTPGNVCVYELHLHVIFIASDLVNNGKIMEEKLIEY
jgi:hypothetical protein